MTRNCQKKQELESAKCTSNLLNEEWCIKEPPNETEWPDLVIRHNEQRFGLEVRNIFLDEKASGSLLKKSGSSLKKGESHRAMLLKKLSEMYYEKSNIPLAIHIAGELKKELLAELLEHIIKEVVLLSVDYKRKRVVINNRKTKIYLFRLPDEMGKYERWLYIDDSVGWVSRLSNEYIEKVVNEKEAKADKYLANISSVRLLLVLDTAKNSGRAEIPTELPVVSDKFEMVYLLSCREKKVVVSKCN